MAKRIDFDDYYVTFREVLKSNKKLLERCSLYDDTDNLINQFKNEIIDYQHIHHEAPSKQMAEHICNEYLKEIAEEIDIPVEQNKQNKQEKKDRKIFKLNKSSKINRLNKSKISRR